MCLPAQMHAEYMGQEERIIIIKIKIKHTIKYLSLVPQMIDQVKQYFVGMVKSVRTCDKNN